MPKYVVFSLKESQAIPEEGPAFWSQDSGRWTTLINASEYSEDEITDPNSGQLIDLHMYPGDGIWVRISEDSQEVIEEPGPFRLDNEKALREYMYPTFEKAGYIKWDITQYPDVHIRVEYKDEAGKWTNTLFVIDHSLWDGWEGVSSKLRLWIFGGPGSFPFIPTRPVSYNMEADGGSLYIPSKENSHDS